MALMSGPAVPEPDWPSWTKAATAYLSFQAIIQAWAVSAAASPNSAVPVLAPVMTPWRTLPDPFATTAFIIVTVIADNYYGYCKKEVKTQIGYSANLFGCVEEEHSGGAIAFPRYEANALCK